MRPLRLTLIAGGVALAALLAVGLTQLKGSTSASPAANMSPAQVRAALAGSPAPLHALHEQGGMIIDGGLAALRSRLAGLRGLPVVINKWASWCQPCRAEFAAFQAVSVHEGRQVAFIGLDSGDTSRTDALAFLRAHPVSYPSYYDADGQAGLALTDSSFTPVTVFYDRAGSQYIHQGPYPSAAKLEVDVRRYALTG
jgi:cytochrome c biogenesis protein CcmG, thiol:disulfide interchange protein DsbE